jgi:hypothetical protein
VSDLHNDIPKVSAFSLLKSEYEQRQKNLPGTIHLSGCADYDTPSRTNSNKIRSMAYNITVFYSTLQASSGRVYPHATMKPGGLNDSLPDAPFDTMRIYINRYQSGWMWAGNQRAPIANCQFHVWKWYL